MRRKGRAYGLLVGTMLVTLAMLFNGPTLSAEDPVVYTVGSEFGDGMSWSIALGDVDQDGDLDALVANSSVGSALWLNDGRGEFETHTIMLPTAHVARVEDVNGDGLPDIILAGWTRTLSIWRNGGDGHFVEIEQPVAISGIIDIASADLDGDADLDLFLARSAEDRVLWNDGQGQFVDSGQRMGKGFSAEVELADIDLDGDMDVLTDGWDGDGHVWYNDGGGTFREGQLLTGPNWHVNGLAVGDVDSDGYPDIVLVSSLFDPHQLWLNDGTGQLSDSGTRFEAPDGYDAAFGDLDDDGDPDLVMGIAGSPRFGIAVWINDNGEFTRIEVPQYEALVREIALGDLDGDGDLDIVGAFLDYSGSFRPKPNMIWMNQRD